MRDRETELEIQTDTQRKEWGEKKNIKTEKRLIEEKIRGKGESKVQVAKR